MLKNVKFLYSVIAVLLVICVLMGSHIYIERNIMYEKRAHYVYTVVAQTEGVCGWLSSSLEENISAEEIHSAVSNAKNYLEALIDTAHFATYYSFYYNELLTEKNYFGGASQFYQDLIHINDKLDLILKNLSEKSALSESDRNYLIEAEKAFNSFFNKLEADGVINVETFQSDTYLTYACMELYDIAK